MITEHSRAVNKLSFHSSDPDLFLSGSQDGTVKLWDMRSKSSAKMTFDCKSESVRDVSFTPVGGSPYLFAASFENGTVQLWDTRNSTG